MEVFLRFIFIVVLIYYGFRLVIRYVVPWLIARFMKKQQDKFNQMGGFSNSGYNQTKEGDVNLNTKRNQKSKKDDGFGEYVDFEDVDD